MFLADGPRNISSCFLEIEVSMLVPDRDSIQAAASFTFMDATIGTATPLPMTEADVKRALRRKRPVGFAPAVKRAKKS